MDENNAGIRTFVDFPALALKPHRAIFHLITWCLILLTILFSLMYWHIHRTPRPLKNMETQRADVALVFLQAWSSRPLYEITKQQYFTDGFAPLLS